MRKKLICAVLAFGGLATFGYAGDRPAVNPPTRAPGDHDRDHEGHDRHRVDPAKTLGDYYKADYQCHIVSEYDVNGIHCFSALAHGSTGDAFCDFTEFGDLIAMGVPEAFNTLTPGAAETAQLFKTPPISVAREDIHGFWVTIKGTANRPYVVEFDATGRIRDIKTPDQLRHDDTNQQRVAGPMSKRVADVTRQRFANVQVEEVTVAGNDPGYYVVPFRNKVGHGWCIINENNDVTEWRFPETFEELPEAVKHAVARDLHGDRILSVEFGAARSYHVMQMVGGEEIGMLLKSDGAVDWISSHQLHAHRFDKR